jgi:AraC family transcriptional regulator
MHLYLGLSLLDRAMEEVHGTVSRPVLRDVSGVRDTEFGLLLETLAREISGQMQPSSLLLESIAQAVSIHLVRGYLDSDRSNVRRRSAIPAYRLRRVINLMRQNLASEFDLGLYARAAEMSEAHFSRQFKRSSRPRNTSSGCGSPPRASFCV